jgi:hypothetical protein
MICWDGRTDIADCPIRDYGREVELNPGSQAPFWLPTERLIGFAIRRLDHPLPIASCAGLF